MTRETSWNRDQGIADMSCGKRERGAREGGGEGREL